MLSQKLQDAINAQINAELWSAYLYLSMSKYKAYFLGKLDKITSMLVYAKKTTKLFFRVSLNSCLINNFGTFPFNPKTCNDFMYYSPEM